MSGKRTDQPAGERAAWVRWFPNNWIGGTRTLTLEEKGFYIEIINQIAADGGPIRDDDKRLSMFMGVSARKARALKEALVAAGKITIKDGHIHQRRALVEVQRAHGGKEKATAIAAAGGRQRVAAAERNKDGTFAETGGGDTTPDTSVTVQSDPETSSKPIENRAKTARKRAENGPKNPKTPTKTVEPPSRTRTRTRSVDVNINTARGRAGEGGDGRADRVTGLLDRLGRAVADPARTPGLASFGVPYGWMEAWDWERFVVPVLTAWAKSHTGEPVRSWSYLDRVLRSSAEREAKTLSAPRLSDDARQQRRKYFQRVTAIAEAQRAAEEAENRARSEAAEANNSNVSGGFIQ